MVPAGYKCRQSLVRSAALTQALSLVAQAADADQLQPLVQSQTEAACIAKRPGGFVETVQPRSATRLGCSKCRQNFDGCIACNPARAAAHVAKREVARLAMLAAEAGPLPQLKAVDVVKLRRRSAPQHLAAVDSNTYNLLQSRVSNTAPLRESAGPQPTTAEDGRRSKSEHKRRFEFVADSAVALPGQPGSHALRNTQARSSAQAFKAFKGASSVAKPSQASEREQAADAAQTQGRKAGRDKAAPMVLGCTAVRVAKAPEKQPGLQTDGVGPACPHLTRHSKRRRRSAVTPGGTHSWVRLAS